MWWCHDAFLQKRINFESIVQRKFDLLSVFTSFSSLTSCLDFTSKTVGKAGFPLSHSFIADIANGKCAVLSLPSKLWTLPQFEIHKFGCTISIRIKLMQHFIAPRWSATLGAKLSACVTRSPQVKDSLYFKVFQAACLIYFPVYNEIKLT